MTAERSWTTAATVGLTEVLEELNRIRREASSSPERTGIDAAVDAILERPSTRLAVYGSLAPGEVNEHVLAPFEGRWKDGHVRGVLHERGWGAGHGFPGLVWNPEGGRVAVRVFISDDLRDHWDRIDAFEGPDYDRILVPVEGLESGVRVCNVYVVAGSGT